MSCCSGKQEILGVLCNSHSHIIFTTACHQAISYARWIQTTTSHPLSLGPHSDIIFPCTTVSPVRSIPCSSSCHNFTTKPNFLYLPFVSQYCLVECQSSPQYNVCAFLNVHEIVGWKFPHSFIVHNFLLCHPAILTPLADVHSLYNRRTKCIFWHKLRPLYIRRTRWNGVVSANARKFVAMATRNGVISQLCKSGRKTFIFLTSGQLQVSNEQNTPLWRFHLLTIPTARKRLENST